MAKKVVKTFEGVLAMFVKTQAVNMQAALDLSRMAIEHFAEHGDVLYAQRFFDAMSKNYVCRVAFVKWMMQFSPATFEAGKFSKDKSEGAKAFDIPGALKVKFWDYAPDKEEQYFGNEDILKALKSTLNRFNKGKVDPKAKPVVDSFANFISLQEKGVAQPAVVH